MVDRSLIKYIPFDLPELNVSKDIERVLPKIDLAIQDCGGRSQTEYMDRNLTVGERPTLLGKARQLMAEMASIKSAVVTNFYKVKIAERDLGNMIDALGRDALEVQQKEYELSDSRVYFKAALKRAAHFCRLYEDLCRKLGVENITEEMIDKNQPEEHLKTMFLQSLRAATYSGGHVDEGDLTYGNQLGLSVSEVQLEVVDFLTHPNGEIRHFDNKEQDAWLEQMWKKYKHRIFQ